VIQLLPALPDAWKQGKVSGLRARGGFTVNMTWNAGKLTSASIYSAMGEPCVVTYGDKTARFKIDKSRSIVVNENLQFPPN
jgi:alpha-L-fucosidase 2